jgi:uncharacterized protein (DUF885 family)
MPACRQTVGITSLDGGLDYYEFLIRYFTTTDLSPEEIHKLGLSEVTRIRAEMQDIIDGLKFDGDFAAFLQYLRTDPKFYARSVSELLGQAALIATTAEGELPRFFSLLPRGTYNIKANPTRGTFYMPASGDGTTSGTYFVGTEQLESQPLYTSNRSVSTRQCPVTIYNRLSQWNWACLSSGASFIIRATERAGAFTQSSWARKWVSIRILTVTSAD